MAVGTIRAGMGGWTFEPWQGSFYPEKLAKAKHLQHASRQVKTIEVNDRAKHLYRDLTPCLYDRGVVYVAPADCREILAIDASTGMLLWPFEHAEDAVHLLGVGGGNLLASGDKL